MFVTADLHVHSFGFSSDVKDSTMTIEAIVDAAVAKGLKLLSVTDHNHDGQVSRCLDYASQFADRLLVVPGVEITTAQGHLLVYCDPATPELISTLLAKIDLKGAKGGRDTHTTRSMTDVIALANDLGAIAVAAHVDREKTGFERLVAGYPHWKRDIILSEGLYGLEFDDTKHLTWFSPEDTGDESAGQRRTILERRTARPEFGIARLAAVQNSDAHTLAAFANNSRLTRFKMNGLSFDGFRTALVDSEARVRAVAAVPLSIPRIIGMQLRGGFVDGGCYQFSPNLNCFIGGRGTGKSTVIQSLGYVVGAHDKFENEDNCPDITVVFCEDANGIRYRFERQRHGNWTMEAEDRAGKHIEAAGRFPVEFYKQGHLSEVAEDPTKNPELLQEFLDQHLELSDARANEAALLQELEHNSAQLKPLEAGALQIDVKQQQAVVIDKKLRAAEEGKLKDVAAAQGQIGAEKAFVETLRNLAKEYELGITLDVLKRDYDQLRSAAGPFTPDKSTAAAFKAAAGAINDLNGWLVEEERRISGRSRVAASAIATALEAVAPRHARWEERIVSEDGGASQQGPFRQSQSAQSTNRSAEAAHRGSHETEIPEATVA